MRIHVYEYVRCIEYMFITKCTLMRVSTCYSEILNEYVWVWEIDRKRARLSVFFMFYLFDFNELDALVWFDCFSYLIIIIHRHTVSTLKIRGILISLSYICVWKIIIIEVKFKAKEDVNWNSIFNGKMWNIHFKYFR